jgi:phosphoribosylformylglycinamidine synthase
LAGIKATDLLTQMIQEDGTKEPIYRQYDHHIGTKTILGPEEQGAGLLWIRSEWADPKETHLGLAVAATCNERYCAQDPMLGAAHAVLKCYRSIAATGAEPLAVTDCLNYGNPEDPEIMGQIVAGIDGIGLACRELGTPVVSGNVSLYNQTDGVSIAPTPMIGMVGKHSDVRKGLPAVLGDSATLYLLKPKAYTPVFGGALVTKVLGVPSTSESIPAVNWQQEKEAAGLIRELMNKDQLSAARDVGAGGVLTTLTKMTLASEKLGLDVLLNPTPAEAMSTWFGESSGTYILASASALDLAALNRTLQHSELVELAKAAPGQDIKFDGQVMGRQHLKASSEASLDI